MDIRFGAGTIQSRAGLCQEADILITCDMNLLEMKPKGIEEIHCVLVDEAQFLSAKHIEQLREISKFLNSRKEHNIILDLHQIR